MAKVKRKPTAHSSGFKLQGDKELIKAFDAIRFSMQRTIVKRAIAEALIPIRSSQIQEIRSQGLIDQANYVTNLNIGKVRKRKTRFSGSVTTGTRSQLRIDQSDKFYYPAVLEYGKKGKGGKFPMTLGYNRAKAMSLSVFQRSVGEQIKKKIKPFGARARARMLQGTALG